MLASIHLHGALRKRYGARHELNVATAAEAIRALCFQLPGFRETIAQGRWRVVLGDARRGLALAAEELNIRLGRKALHIVPVPAGGGGRGGKVILGLTLIATAFAFAFVVPFGATAGATAGFLGGTWGAYVVPGLLTAGNVATLGVALTLAGAAALLSPKPRVDNSKRSESYLLNGPTNVTAQGVAVPLIYGRCRVGSVVAAAGLATEDVRTASAAPFIPPGAIGVSQWESIE